MKLSTSLVDHPGRAAIAVGAMVAVSTISAVALSSATAAADEPGRCTENVNVRAEPDISSRIVTLCRAGTTVQIGETRNGFVQLVGLEGWAAEEFVSLDGDTPAPDERETEPDGDDSDDSDSSAGGGGSDAQSSDDSADSDDDTGSSDSSSSGGSSSGGSGGSGGGSSSR